MNSKNLSHSDSPLYIQIRDLYRNQILSGELEYGEKIESELEIQRLFSVSRITARQAITDLEKEGLVSRARGRGTFVCYKPKVKNPLSLGSFTEYARTHGKTPGTPEFNITRVVPNEDLTQIFEMVSAKPLYCFERVRTIDGVRMCYMLNFFPEDLALPWNTEDYDESVYRKLMEVTGTSPFNADEEFSALVPNPEVCEGLGIDPSVPVLCKRRRSYDDKGRVVEYSVCYYRGDLYSHELNLADLEEDNITE